MVVNEQREERLAWFAFAFLCTLSGCIVGIVGTLVVMAVWR